MTSDDSQARDGRTPEKLPPGLYRRGGSLWMRFRVGGGREQREPVPADENGKQLSPRAAARLRAERITQLARGEVVADSRRLTVGALLDAVLLDYEVNRRGSIATARARLRILRDAVGSRLAVTFTTEDVQRLQVAWQRGGLTAATINRRCNLLRRAFRLAWRAGKLPRLLYVPRLDEHAPRGRYLSEEDAEKIAAALPEYARRFFRFARLYGTRKGQLAHTQRRFVNLDRGVIEWPAAVCKAREPHTLPLEGEGLALVEQLMRDARPWCPYLFHGPRCAPGRKRSRFACIGDFKKAWRSALDACGLPAGRAAGGYVFHNTRHSAATDLAAAGCTIEDVMAVGGRRLADGGGGAPILTRRRGQAQGAHRGGTRAGEGRQARGQAEGAGVSPFAHVRAQTAHNRRLRRRRRAANCATRLHAGG